MPEKIHADIPLSFFEYHATFQEPLFDVPRFVSDVVKAVFREFRRLDIALENVTPKPNPPNLGEVAVTFALFGGRVTFTVRLGSIALVVQNPNWSEEPLIADVVRTGVAAVLDS